GARRDAANLALEDRIGERDRTHRPHLAALQRRRHERPEGRRAAGLDDQVVAAGEELVGDVGHREPVQLAGGASEHPRERVRSSPSGQQRARDGPPDRPATDEADPRHRRSGVTPSTRTTLPRAVRNLSAFSTRYSSESYRRRARRRNLPPYLSTVPCTCFRYSSNPAGSVT